MLQYYCGNCKEMLKEINHEISFITSIEPCPFCGILLSDVLEKKPVREKQNLEVVFQKASQISRLTLGIPSLDSCFNFMSTYDKICISGIGTQSIVERLCVRAQMPHRYGGLGTNVLLIDGANTSDLYQCVDYAQRYGLDIKKTLKGIISSRAFSVYQIANTIIDELENAIKHYKVKIVIITNLLYFFTKGIFLDSNEIIQILKQITKSIQKINDCLVVMTTDLSTQFNSILYNICTKTIKIESSHNGLSVKINNKEKQKIVFLKKEEIESICV